MAALGDQAVTVLAHTGHWYVSLPIFMGPVALLLAWVYLGDWRDRRRGRDGRE